MNIVEYTNKFFAIEGELDLFSDRVDGIAWWDAVRYEVFHRVYYQAAGMAAHGAKFSIHQRLASYVARKWLKICLRVKSVLRSYDIIVFRCPRHQERGKRIDISIDHVLAAVQGSRLVINTYPFYYHRPLRIRRRSKVPRPAMLDLLIQAIEREFTVPVGFESFVLDQINAFISSTDQYRRLFRRIRPRLIFMVQNGVEKGMFSAARGLKIPVIEVQHGLIQYVHPGYSYPRDLHYADITSFPDYFFAFSQYWIDSCHYPAPHRTSIGNDNFFVEHTPPSARKSDVLFVSVNVYDRVLRRWIKAVAARLPQHKLIYKLHPNQRREEAEIRTDLASLSNVEVVGNLLKVRDLLPNTAVVVAIQSTVVHEALQAGKLVCILPEFDYQTHSDLFSLPQVSVIRSEDELIRVIESPPAADLSVPVFFDRFDDAKVRRLVADILMHHPRDDLTRDHRRIDDGADS
jgi:hypothetical protein